MSKYLPADFDRTAPVGLIAGRGVYPRLIAEKALAAGIDMRLIAFDGEAPPKPSTSSPRISEPSSTSAKSEPGSKPCASSTAATPSPPAK